LAHQNYRAFSTSTSVEVGTNVVFYQLSYGPLFYFNFGRLF